MTMSPSRPRWSVVVLSFNLPDLRDKALRSSAAQSGIDRDVVVIDNPSPQSPRIREIVTAFKDVRLVANQWNSGFTGGMNQGLAAATAEYIYLTEDDLELDGACLAPLVDYLATHQEAGLAGPVMWNLQTPTIRCAGGQFVMGTTYQMRITAAGEREPPDGRPFETMYLPGATIAARTSVLREIGGFHPDFFMYGEDVELCARTLERGLKIA